MVINSLNIKLKNALRVDRALKFVWKASPVHAVLSGMNLIVLGLLPILSLYLLKLIIDSVTQLVFHNGNNISSKDFSNIFILIGLACGVGLLILFFNFLADYIKKAQTLTIADYMFSVLHEKSARADLEYYESPEYQNTLHRAQQEGPYRPASIVQGLFSAGQSGTSFIAVVGLLFMFKPFLPFILICVSIPGVFIRFKYSEKIYSWQQKRTEDERKSNYYNYILTGNAHAKEVRLFNLGQYFAGRFMSVRKLLKREKLQLEKKRIFGDFIAQSTSTIVVFGTFAYIAHRTVQGSITLGDMVMYFQAFQRGTGYLKALLESIAQMYEDNLFLSNFYDFLHLKPTVTDTENPCKLPVKIGKGIRFNNVGFFYHNCKKNVLKTVNFTIKPGETIALVGENGSGKSTIVKLLARLYDPQKGDILLDGENIKNFKTEDFRKKISVVFQDHIKYQLSAKENIYLGDIEQKNNLSKIKEAAVQADVDGKISGFSSGYDTILGRWFKNGEELSIGQWQMMAISRAFFRDAELVILDEPSSALDPETEMRIFSKLKKLIQGRSALIISHRYSTVKMADKILVLDKGTIVEQGSHSELMKKNGKYARLFSAQAQAYV